MGGAYLGDAVEFFVVGRSDPSGGDVDGAPGVIRVDLGNEIETLRFAYANDLYVSTISGYKTTTCAFAGETNRLIFATTANNAGTITNKALTSNVATLTTSAAHGLAVDDEVWVEGVDATFNGKYTVYNYSIGVCVCIGASMSWAPPMTAHAAHAPKPPRHHATTT